MSGNDSARVGRLEDEALKRKERLKALKKGELKDVNAGNEKSKNAVNFPKPMFRNYNPKDESLKESVFPKPKLIEIEDEIKEHLENAKPAPLIEKEIDLTTLAPQKIDWDLKRDVEKKLRILEKRTERAIVELIRERIKGEKNSDLAELVSVGSRDNIKRSEVRKTNNKSDEDEDDEDDEEEEEANYAPSTSGSQLSASALNIQDNEALDDLPFEPNTKTEISDDEDIY